jgi:tetratricopeptide (TPR) repeat protein
MKGSIKDSLPLLEAALELEGDSSNEHRAMGHAWAGRMAQLARGATADAVGHAERAVTLARSASSRTFAVAAVIASLMRSFRGLTNEAGEVIDEALARLENEPDVWGQAWADWAHAGLLVKHGDRQQATELTRRSIAGFAEVGDQYGGAIAAISLGELAELWGDYEEATSSTLSAYNSLMVTGANSFNASVRATRLGNLAATQGDFEQAASWYEQGLSQARVGEFPAAIAQAFSGMGEAARRGGELAAAASYHREALGRFEASESSEGASLSLSCLGLIATAEGDPVAATKLHKKGLAKAFSSSDRRGAAFAVEGLAEAYAACGDACWAAALLGTAEALREAAGGPPPALQRVDLDRAEQRVRSLLATDVYAAERARGRAEADAIVACLVSDDDGIDHRRIGR